MEVMTVCVILHNMIVKDGSDDICNVDFEKYGEHAHLLDQKAEPVS